MKFVQIVGAVIEANVEIKLHHEFGNCQAESKTDGQADIRTNI